MPYRSLPYFVVIALWKAHHNDLMDPSPGAGPLMMHTEEGVCSACMEKLRKGKKGVKGGGGGGVTDTPRTSMTSVVNDLHRV